MTMTMVESNPRATIGGNAAPSSIEFARDAYRDLSKFLADNPVIQDQESASAAKLHLDRARATAKDLEEAELNESKPLYDAWKAAKERFRPAAEALDKITSELKIRIKAFLD